jgi:hypothetical protein
MCLGVLKILDWNFMGISFLMYNMQSVILRYDLRSDLDYPVFKVILLLVSPHWIDRSCLQSELYIKGSYQVD